jgi:glycerophosphoryl diester phosphodiesterase
MHRKAIRSPWLGRGRGGAVNALPSRLVFGHRGSSADAPENTMRAFRLALEQGADGIEFDVQPSGDGVPVVIHDDTVERTTDGVGVVGTMPWEALARLDAGGGERIPRLDEVAAWAAETGAWLNVELKAAGAEAESLRVLREAGVLERTVFSSFDPEVVAAVGRLDPGVRRFLLTERWDAEAAGVAGAVGAGGICLENAAATPVALADLHERGLPVVVWTVDDPRRVAALLDAGVAAVISNVPAHAVAARRLGGG